MGVSQIQGYCTNLVVLITRIIAFRDLYWDHLISGNYQMSQIKAARRVLVSPRFWSHSWQTPPYMKYACAPCLYRFALEFGSRGVQEMCTVLGFEIKDSVKGFRALEFKGVVMECFEVQETGGTLFARCQSAFIELDYLEGQGHLVTRLIMGIIGVTIWVIGVINLLTKFP